jgi:hypothetical protein
MVQLVGSSTKTNKATWTYIAENIFILKQLTKSKEQCKHCNIKQRDAVSLVMKTIMFVS